MLPKVKRDSLNYEARTGRIWSRKRSKKEIESKQKGKYEDGNEEETKRVWQIGHHNAGFSFAAWNKCSKGMLVFSTTALKRGLRCLD